MHVAAWLVPRQRNHDQFWRLIYPEEFWRLALVSCLEHFREYYRILFPGHEQCCWLCIMMVTFLSFQLNLAMIILGDTGLHSSKTFAPDSLSINTTSSRCACCCSVEYPLSSCNCNLFCSILLAQMLYCHISLATWAAFPAGCRHSKFQS